MDIAKLRKVIRLWYYNLTFKICGVKAGPLMVRMRGEWMFIDCYGALWRVTPTMDPHMPLTISLQVKP